VYTVYIIRYKLLVVFVINRLLVYFFVI